MFTVLSKIQYKTAYKIDQLKLLDDRTILNLIYVLYLFQLLFLVLGFKCFQAHDTTSYFVAGQNWLQGHPDLYRTPIYPILCSLIEFISKQYASYIIIILQCLIYFYSIKKFYKISQYVLKSKGLCIAATLLYVTHPYLLSWNFIVLTESLSISLFIIWLSYVVDFIQKPMHKKSFTLTLCGFLFILFRPSFINLVILLGIGWLILIFNKKYREYTISGLVGFVATLFLIIGYNSLIYSKYKVFTISSVSDINVYTTLRTNNLLDPSLIENKELALFIQEKKTNNYTEAWKEALYIISHFSYKDLHQLNHINIKPNIKKLLILHIKEIQHQSSFKNYTVYNPKRIRSIGFIENIYGKLFSISFYSIYFILAFITFGLIVYLMIMRKKNFRLPIFLCLMLGLIWSNLIITFFGAYSEYDRLIVVSYPLMLLCILKIIDIVYNNMTSLRNIDWQNCLK